LRNDEHHGRTPRPHRRAHLCRRVSALFGQGGEERPHPRELHEAIRWLTGYDNAALQARLAEKATFADFFATATLNPAARGITGMICGYRVEEIADPLLTQRVR